MMYVLKPLRDLVLGKRGCLRKIPDILESIARPLGTALGLKKVILIFDRNCKTIDEENFAMFSATPKYQTSDEAMIDIARSTGTGVYVTSDRGLIEQLRQAGGLVMKPKTWFVLAARTLGGDASDLDSWMENWIENNKLADDLQKLSM